MVDGRQRVKVLVPRQFGLVSRNVNMEVGFKETRMAVTALQKYGKSHFQIFETLETIKNFTKFRLSGN